MLTKTMKRISFCLAIVMILSCFAGCGQKKEEEVLTSGSKVTLNGDKIYPIQCDDTLTFWFAATNVWNQKYENFIETPLGKEIEKKTGIKIEYMHPSEGQGAEQFQIMIVSDELPDIVNNSWYSFAGGPDRAIEDNYIYRLNDIIEKYCPAFNKIMTEKPEWGKNLKTDQGSYFGFPGLSQGGILRVAYGPVLRGDWLQELGLERPRNINEWEKVLTAFKEEKGVKIPFLGDLNMLFTTFGPAFGIYTGWYQNDGKIVYGSAQPEYKEFLSKMHEWYEKGLIDEDFAVLDPKKLDLNMTNGGAGSTLAWAGSGMGVWLTANKNNPTYTVVGTQFPAVGNGTGNAEYSYYSREVSASGTTTAISKNCKNVELAARFLDWGYTEEGHNVYNFGVEGESFNWVDKDGEKYPQYTDLIMNNPEGYTVSDMLHFYTRSAHVNVPMTQDIRYMEQYYPHEEQTEAQKYWGKTNMTAHHIPSTYILTEQSDDDSNTMAAVSTYVQEMSVKFINGREPLENFDKYIEQLEKFGIEKSIQYRQEAFERFEKR